MHIFITNIYNYSIYNYNLNNNIIKMYIYYKINLLFLIINLIN